MRKRLSVVLVARNSRPVRPKKTFGLKFVLSAIRSLPADRSWLIPAAVLTDSTDVSTEVPRRSKSHFYGLIKEKAVQECTAFPLPENRKGVPFCLSLMRRWRITPAMNLSSESPVLSGILHRLRTRVRRWTSSPAFGRSTEKLPTTCLPMS